MNEIHNLTMAVTKNTSYHICILYAFLIILTLCLQFVTMEQYVCKVEQLLQMAELKCATTIHGEQSVTTCGAIKMRRLCVGNLDIQVWKFIQWIEKQTYCTDYFCTAGTALSNAYYGQGNVSALLDNLNCLGTETSLLNCPNSGIGVTSCTHADDASVQCTGKCDS